MRLVPWTVSGLLALLCSIAVAQEPARSPARPRPDADANAGSLQGSIVLGPKLSTRKMRFHLYPDALAPASLTKPAFHDELRNVVVYLEASSPVLGPAARPGPPLVIEQRNLTFEPHVLAVPKGSMVEFPNGDPIFHNVFSLSRAASFDLGRYPRGSSRSVRFDEPGIVKVFCHVHSDMSAVIVVLDNPYFISPDERGRFRIDDIPPGDYVVVGWHERARPVRRKVRIERGETTAIRFTIPLSEAGDGG